MTDAELLLAASAFIRYEPETGNFYAVRNSSYRKAGAITGFAMKNGYTGVHVFGRQFYAHRLAWLFQSGAMPAMKIDHINGNRKDNRIVNLRLASDVGNAENIRAAHKDSATGLLGVCYEPCSGRYIAQLRSKGRKGWIARFATAEQAHAAYLVKKREMHALCTI